MSIEIRVGSDFEFVCEVINGSAVFFEWTISGQDLPNNTQQEDVNNTVSVLSISSVEQMNAGSYICTALLDDGTSQTAFGALIFVGKYVVYQLL